MEKTFKTIEEQIKLLQSRKLQIENKEVAEEILLNNNYYYYSYKIKLLAKTRKVSL